MPRMSLESFIGSFPNINNQQLNLLRNFYAAFDTRITGANRYIANIEPLFFYGAVAGTEFLTYAVTKMYIAFLAEASGQALTSAAGCNFSIYDAANAICGMYSDTNAYWDGAAVKYNHNAPRPVENIYFSRVSITTLAYFRFNGYRITLS